MKYRQINTDFWEDGYILELTSKERDFFIYLFTNPKVNMVGIYELPDRIICSTLGATLDELKKMKAKFETDRKYFFFKGWVFVNNFSRHNKYSSAPNIIKTYLHDFNSIPQDVLNHFFTVLKLEYKPTIENKSIVIVMDNVNVKEGRGYPRGYPRIEAKDTEERVNPDDLPL